MTVREQRVWDVTFAVELAQLKLHNFAAGATAEYAASQADSAVAMYRRVVGARNER